MTTVSCRICIVAYPHGGHPVKMLKVLVNLVVGNQKTAVQICRKKNKELLITPLFQINIVKFFFHKITYLPTAILKFRGTTYVYLPLHMFLTISPKARAISPKKDKEEIYIKYWNIPKKKNKKVCSLE